MKQILNNISRITLSIMREGRGVGLLLITLVMMAMSPQNVWAENLVVYNGDTITISSDATYDAVMVDNGTLTIKNGATLTINKNYDISVCGGTVIIESGATVAFLDEGDNFIIRGGKTFNYGTINGNVFLDINDYCFANWGTVNGDVDNNINNVIFYNFGTIEGKVYNDAIVSVSCVNHVESTNFAPTCTDAGGSRCKECGEISNITPATGHNFENGTCTKCGTIEPILPFDLAITKAGASSATLSKEIVKSITINRSEAGATQVAAQSGSEEETPTQLEHGTRYDFAITAVPTLQPGDDNLNGNIVAKVKRRTAAQVQEPTLNGPALVVGTATAYTTYPLDAEHTDIKLQFSDGGKLMVNGTEVEGVTSIYFVDAHVFTSETVSETYLKTAATCTTDAVYYHKCAGCDASSENNTNSTWTKAGSASHNYANGICTHCGDEKGITIYTSVQQDGTKLNQLGTAAFKIVEGSAATLEFVDGKAVMKAGTTKVAELPMSDKGEMVLEFSTTVPAADLNKVSKTVTAAGYATLYSPFQLAVPAEGTVEVYAPEFDEENSLLKCHKVNAGSIVPAGTGLMLKNDGQGSIDFKIANAAPSEIVSSLDGTALKIPVPTIEGKTICTLGKGAVSNQYGFYSFNGNTLAAGSAYLAVTTPQNNEARAISIVFDDDVVTLIGEVQSAKNCQTTIRKYLENGRIVIMNGNQKYNVNGQMIK